ncbi:predicted protein [Candida tropicalis MYA-3404]|uniref:Uncharacterized protein n=1 Tax=Candida tropicalis (strain ATCC MYA-3404 / T1) TaxID=294747 RepID=C5M6V4_CANTT|nr:predicted protein [Candida tropicalis MYA-3404]EER34724.1 predicted protein [Candida tropicalis MYA-3404]KAG4408601.1 hypothetical protein JTP64_001907 [Candida tropicalis]
MSTDYLWTEDELNLYEIENRFNDTTITFIIVSKDIPTCLTKLSQFLDPWIKSYPWIIQPPTITQQQTVFNNLTIDYIHGELNYHEYIRESLLLVSLLFQFTKYHKDSYIHIFDSIDIEPLLIHCHDFLPNDLEEVGTSINRVWIHDYSIIVLNLHDDRYINLYLAIQQLNNQDYTINSAMSEYWKNQSELDEYLKYIHDVKIDNLPKDVGKLITNDVNLLSLSLISLENESKIDKIELHEEEDRNNNCSVSIPMNTLNLGVILAICQNRPDLTAKDVIVNGLLKFYNDLNVKPEIPSDIKQVSRYDLQKELINRGLIDHEVGENKDAYELFSSSFDKDDEEEVEEEEKLASQLNEILNISKNILEEEDEEIDDEEDDPDYDEFDGNERLMEFREKYFEITDIWLDKDKTIEFYDKFKLSMLNQVETFRLDFKNSEFEDFPEFLETNVILGIEEEEKERKRHEIGEYQGDMNYAEYMKFKKKLRKQGDIVDDSDDEDSDWEDIDDDQEEDEEEQKEEEQIDSDDEDDEFAYHQTTPLSQSPKITEIDDSEINEPQIVELSENLKNLQTDPTPKTLEDILIERYTKY